MIGVASTAPGYSLAASLGSFISSKERRVVEDDEGTTEADATPELEPIDELLAEVRALRVEVAELKAQLPPSAS